ncbi:MAG: hypothetical protein ACOH1I_01275 [Gallionellaceae bacterium]|jgi:hypothetical protein
MKMKTKIRLVKFLAIIAIGSQISPVMAKGSSLEPIGDYTSVGGKLYKTTYANSSSDYNGLGVKVSYQLIPNFFVGINAESARNSANNNNTISDNGVFLGLVMGVGTSVDLGLVLSPISRTHEVCSGSLCATSSETDSELFGKWWLGKAKNFNVGLHLSKYTYSNTNTTNNSTGLSFAYFVGKKHEWSFKGSRLRDSNDNDISTTSSFEYNYHFK